MTNTMFSGPLAQELTDFLEWRGGAGHGSRSILRQLQTFDRFTQVTVSSSRLIDETFARAWLAPAPGRGNNTRRSRYFLLRSICFFLADRQPGTFLPTPALCPRHLPPSLPHIYNPDEIRRLLKAASNLRDWDCWHPCPIRSHTLHAILVLLVTSGLRISEALHLTVQDVDLNRGILAVRQTKFRKSRLVPVSSGTLDGLRRYAAIRFRGGVADSDAAFFISGRQRAYSYAMVSQLFHQIVATAGIGNTSGRRPRLHDMRHTFAVTRLLLWYRAGENVMARLPLLSTYLGHACISDTEVYLQATSELLTEANQRFHRFVADILPAGGEP
jgi:integrase/recombinase XerD